MRKIYTVKNVAKALDVDKKLISEWVLTYGSTPLPDFITADGEMFWSTIADWREWYHTMHNTFKRPLTIT